jgi:hypothetical protein
LTKLSAQVSVLMADRTATSINASSMSDPVNTVNTRAVAASYQNKGTFKTAKNIIKHRGFMGLYSGFGLHLRKVTPFSAEFPNEIALLPCVWKTRGDSKLIGIK